MSRGSLKHISGRGRAATRTPAARGAPPWPRGRATCSATECMPPPWRATNCAAPPSPTVWPISMALSPSHAIPPRRPIPGSSDSPYSSTSSPNRCAQARHGHVVVGHHRRGVEQPAHLVAGRGARRRHRPASPGARSPVMLRAPGPARNSTASATSSGSTCRRSAAPAAMRREVSSALSPVRSASVAHQGVERRPGDVARRDHVHPHVARAELLGQGQRGRDHGLLGRRVAGPAERAGCASPACPPGRSTRPRTRAWPGAAKRLSSRVPITLTSKARAPRRPVRPRRPASTSAGHRRAVATFTRTSSRPAPRHTASTSARHDDRSPTSTGERYDRPPGAVAASSLGQCAARRSPSRAATTTSAPAAAQRAGAGRPIRRPGARRRPAVRRPVTRSSLVDRSVAEVGGPCARR